MLLVAFIRQLYKGDSLNPVCLSVLSLNLFAIDVSIDLLLLRFCGSCMHSALVCFT